MNFGFFHLILELLELFVKIPPKIFRLRRAFYSIFREKTPFFGFKDTEFNDRFKDTEFNDLGAVFDLLKKFKDHSVQGYRVQRSWSGI